MKTDSNGCSSCKPGEEQWEEFYTPQGNKRIQYDYRAWSGQLFSCVAVNIDEARKKRDDWYWKEVL
jgi:hypothetical protein